ncbi:hypothetical protein AB0L80_38690 [Streptomyces sp. NPDC052069]|uniref:hypothetical protein n=1 Tax=Streptomyces sp. NPDC052069 TaxID=3154650 RepID=UPI00344535BA
MTAEIVQPAIPAPAPARVFASHHELSPRAARRLAIAERVLYGAGGVLAAVGPHTDIAPLHLAAMAAGVGVLAHLWRRTRSASGGLLLSCYRALPVLGLSGCYTAALASPGIAWWEVAAPVATAALAGAAAPLTRSCTVRQAIEELPQEVAAYGQALEATTATPVAQGAPATYEEGLRQLWAASTATGTTTLEQIVQPDPLRPDFTAVIMAPSGETVPRSLDERTVAGVFDIPVEAVVIGPVKGFGPGRLALAVTPAGPDGDGDDDQADPDGIRAMWEDRVSGPGGGAPGMLCADYKLTDDKLVVLVQAAEGKMIDLSRNRLARALRVEDPELVMVETDGLASGVVTIYREHPLIHIRQATVADLTMDKHGRIAIGLRHDGRPARMRLFDPELGALTDLLVGAPGSGKSVTLLTLIAAERISGVVSVVADAQDGMSLPEAQGRVAHFGAGRAAMGATLAAVCAVADHREQISAENGWGSFTLGEPWALLITTLDEINRVLAADADVHADYRKWLSGMISRIQLTGRKLGLGIRFAGQSIHLEDLGDSDKIRSGARQGTVWLGRVNGSQTRRMATDMTTGAIEVTPIPQHFGAGGAGEIEAAWAGDEAETGPVTAGCAWMIQGGHPSLTRVFRAVKEKRTYPGLIALMESAPVPTLTPEETKIFQEAYETALPYAEKLMTGGAGRTAASLSDDDNDGDHGDDYDGEDDGEERPRHTAPQTPAAPAAAPPVLADLVLAALADGPRRTRDIRHAVGVGTPDGPASGSVDNTLSKLHDQGLVTRPGHGTWALPDQPTTES